MKTRITELFNIEHPIIQGGMHHVGFAELAAAVSNAGGLGTITGLTQGTPEKLAKEIARCQEMTDKPVRHSLKAQSIGCDAVSVDGFECGGHPGEDDIPNFILLPRAADELEIPFVASGGMADARSLVAAMALGADGMNMGTRFIATQDAPVHQNVKEAIINASELDTRLVMRSLRNTERVLNNGAVERLLEKEKELGADLKFEDIIDEVAGVYPKIMHEGTMEAGAWSCGMVAGLVNDIPTVQDLIHGIMSQADEIIKSRLQNF